MALTETPGPSSSSISSDSRSDPFRDLTVVAPGLVAVEPEILKIYKPTFYLFGKVQMTPLFD